jgi:hypothetical protein
MARRPGYIYVMRLHTSDNAYECPYKIGQSVRPSARQGQLGIVMPYQLSILHVFPADDMDAAEREMHTTPTDQRMQGEWFHFDRDYLETILAIRCFKDGLFQIAKDVPTLPENYWDGVHPNDRDLPF